MSAMEGSPADQTEPGESSPVAEHKTSLVLNETGPVLSQETGAVSQETGPKPLCGWLQKQVKLPIKAWKPKWFVFDEKRCCLYYYNQKNDPSPLGKIDIAMATLSYEVDNLNKHQFEVLSEGRSISLQASSSEAMMYWLTQLQNRRRRFTSRDRKLSHHEQASPADGSGLISGSQENLLSPDSDTPTILPPTAPPTDLEDLQAFNTDQTPTRGLSSKLTLRRLTRKPSPGVQRKLQARNPKSPDECELTNGIQDEPSCDISEGGEARPKPLHRKTLSLLNWKTRDHGPCVRCQQLQERIDELESDLRIKTREVCDRDEINEFLRNEIRLGDLRAKAQAELAETNDKKLDVLLQRNQTIDQLQHLLEAAIGDRDRASTELEAKRVELKVLGEQVASYKEALTAKDHVVVDLTNKLFTLEHKGQLPNSPTDPMMPLSSDSYKQQIQKLEEAVEAYRLQNRFLSSELVELNAARAADRDSYKALESKYMELDAEHLRTLSKHMVLLQESQQPRMNSGAGPDTSVVTQMLEEALQSEGEKSPTNTEASTYDRYGFSHTHAASDVGNYTDPLTVKARKLDQQAHRARNETPGVKRDRWEALLTPGRELQRTEELKRMIRGGIPHCYRSNVWQWIIRERLGKAYIKGQFEAILAQHAGQSSIAVNQIELDLLRTLPTNKFYDSPNAPGIDKLRRILVAFSWYDPKVGYCQGLNRLAAIALLFLSEEDAFWCLVAIVHNLLPLDYYSHTLLGSQTDQRVLRDLLQDHASKLYAHLSSCDIDLSMITFNWFHTIFVDNLPVETMLRIWDTFLYEGSKVLFRFAIAIFKYNEEALLDIENSIGIFNRVRSMCQDATDVNKLAQIAFTEIGSFPMRPINQKRAHYRHEIKAELDALEALRASHTPAATPTGEATPTDNAAIKYTKIMKDRDDSSPEVEELIYLD